MTAPFETTFISPVLVERDLQRDALMRLVGGALAGVGTVALVAGEAGIGKSRLLRAIQDAAIEAYPGVRLVAAACSEYDAAVPYAPLMDVLRSVSGDLTPSQVQSPELVPLLTGAPPSDEQAAVEQPLRFRAIGDVLLSLAGRATLLFTVEDVHWCDDATLDFLAAFAPRIRAAPIAVVLTYRSDEVTPALARTLAALDRQRAAEFRLPRLTPAALTLMLRAILGSDRRITSEWVESMHAVTDGVPFYVEEVLKAISTVGDVALTSDRWRTPADANVSVPRTVDVAVQQRASRLTLPAREVLTVASVIGRRFDFVLIQTVTGRSDAELEAVMRELTGAQLVSEESADEFAFRHALTRQAVYSKLLAREQRALHGSIARALLAADMGDSRLNELAYHTYAAQMWPEALVYAHRAGQHAQRLHSPRAAIEHFTRAVEVAERLRSLAWDMLETRGKLYEQVGDFDAARADYERAGELARAAGLPAAESACLLDLGFLWTGRDWERAGSYFAHAVELARQSGDPLLLANALNRVGNWHANRERSHEALRLHEEALRLFEDAGDVPGAAATYDLLGVTHVLSGDMVASLAAYHQAVARFRQLDDPMALSSCLATLSLAGASYMADASVCPVVALETSIAEGQEALAIARKIGWQPGEASAQMYFGLGMGARGQYALALEVEQNALRVASAIDHPLWIAGAHMGLGRVAADLFDPAAREHLALALAGARETGAMALVNAVSAFSAMHAIDSGDLAAAESFLAPVYALMDDPARLLTQFERLGAAACAELAVERRDTASALAILRRLIDTSPRADGNPAAIPRIGLTYARALALRGQADDALAILTEALNNARAHGTWPLAWRILAHIARLHLSEGRRADADSAASDARGIIGELAAKIPAEALRAQFVERAAAQLPSPPAMTARQAAKSVSGGLTERERDIAVRVAQGLTSREIADALVLSKRTVDAHIGNILLKLDLTSRTQIARWVIEKGLSDEG